MSDLDKLKIVTPLFSDEESRETDYVNVSFYKYFRVTTYADIDLQLDIIFSFDGVTDGPVASYAVNTKWQTRKIEILLPFMKLRVLRATPGYHENKLLVVNLLSRTQLEPKHEELKHEEHKHEEHKPVEHKQEQRSKSPFSGILKRGRSDSTSGKSGPVRSEKINVSDPRIPSYLPKNGLLVGSGFSNSIITIPPPTDDDSVLCFTGGRYEWVILSDLIRDTRHVVKFEDES